MIDERAQLQAGQPVTLPDGEAGIGTRAIFARAADRGHQGRPVHTRMQFRAQRGQPRIDVAQAEFGVEQAQRTGTGVEQRNAGIGHAG